MTADEELRQAAQAVMDAFPPVAHPATPRGEVIERLRDALAARSEPRSCDPREHGGKHAPWCHAARSEPTDEGLRGALQAIIDLRVVVPDHPHGGVHPPYLEWLKVADIARRALAARSEPRCEACARGDRDTHAQHLARPEPLDIAEWDPGRDAAIAEGDYPEPRAEGLREAWAAYTMRFADPDDPTRDSETKIRDAFEAGWNSATPPAEGLDVDALIDELSESPLPGARYAVTVVKYHAEKARRAAFAARSEPRAEGLREGDWLCPTCGTLFRFQPDAATPPAECGCSCFGCRNTHEGPEQPE